MVDKLKKKSFTITLDSEDYNKLKVLADLDLRKVSAYVSKIMKERLKSESTKKAPC